MSGHVQPLNPLLYSLLERRYRRVWISHQGEAAQPFPERDAYGRQRYRFKGGEYYAVQCPFCHDTRIPGRLYFSYLWGRPDPTYGGTRHLNLAICYNEDCLTVAGTVEQLQYEIYGLLDPRAIANSPVYPGVSASDRPIGSPGRVIRLADLPPSHNAVAYLASRGFDTNELSNRYQVGYCEEPAVDYPMMWNRIVLPIIQGGQYVGFQGRVIGDVGVPRYYNPPGSTKTNWLYNLDIARQYRVLVLTEGATKVWRIGPFAAALFGKSVSGKQPEMIADLAQRADFVVLYLDGEAWKPRESKNHSSVPKLSSAESAIQTLRLHVPEHKLVVIRLAPEQSPDEISTAANHQIIEGALAARGWSGSLLAQQRHADSTYRLPARRVVTQ